MKVLDDRADDICAEKEKRYGSPLMREFERVVLLRTVDIKWMDHIDAMEELRKGIYLRSYGQRDPVVEYRIEGFNMFDEMVASIRRTPPACCSPWSCAPSSLSSANRWQSPRVNPARTTAA
ncbi:MAG: hypothetical protein V8T36_07085 [Ruthenibacterium lactatiformans]